MFSVFVMTFTHSSSLESTLSNKISALEDSVDHSQEIGLNAFFDNATEVGQWDKSYGELQNVVVKGTTAFAASRHDGLIAFDISNSSLPLKIGQYILPEDELVEFVAIDGNTAYLCCNYYGIVTVDVTDPTNLQFLDSYNDGASTHEVIVDSGYAYVAAGWDGIEILDVSDPSDISEIGSIYEGSFFLSVIEKYGNYILTTDNGGPDMKIVNVTLPTSPTEVTTFAASSIINDIRINDDYAYLIRAHNCEIVNLSIIDTPISEVNYSLAFTMATAEIESDILYVGGYYGFAIYNISNPIVPVWLSSKGTTESVVVRRLCINNTNLIISLQSKGFEIFDVTDKSSTVLLGAFLNYGDFCDVDIDEDLAFVVSTNGFLIFNISDKEDPYLVNFTQIFSDNYLGQSIIVEGEIVYFVHRYFLYIYDVSSPSNPVLLNDSLNVGQTYDMVINGNYLFLAQLNKMSIIDISVPTTPVVAKSFSTGVNAYDMAFKDNYMYLASYGNGITIVDVTDVFNPSIFNTIDPGGNTLSCYIDGNYLFAYSSTIGLYVLDITDTNSITQIDSVPISGFILNSDIMTEGQYLYLSKEEYGLYIFDKSDPANLVSAGRFSDDSGQIFGFKVSEGKIFTADFNDGLEIIIHDSDGDGLSNYEEIEIYFTDPDDSDSDDDGFDDKEEVELGVDGFITNPNSQDTDSDGLSDPVEMANNTDPTDSDTDDDLIPDGYEIDNGLDPLVDDAGDDEDLDTLTNLEEYNLGTDPNDTDTDDDNIDDYEETVAGTDGFVTDPTDADTDGDGIDDDVEIVNGTDPTDPNDPPTSTPSPTPTGGLSWLLVFGLALLSFSALIVLRLKRRK